MRTGLLAARQSTPLATRSLASDLVLRCCSSSAAAQLPWYKLLFEKKGLREGAGARTGWPSTWLLFPHGLSTVRALAYVNTMGVLRRACSASTHQLMQCPLMAPHLPALSKPQFCPWRF